MEETKTQPMLLPPSLPYALDYLGLVALCAAFSLLFFKGRLDSWALALPAGLALTLLASVPLYRWQYRRWQRRRERLETQALALWLADALLAGSVRQMDELALRYLAQRLLSKPQRGRPLILYQGNPVRLYSLRRHPSCPADAQQVMQLHEASLKNAQGALILSTAGFTATAREYAAEQPSLALTDMEELARQAACQGLRIPAQDREPYARGARRQLDLQRRQRPARPRLLWVRLALGALLLTALALVSPVRGILPILAACTALASVFAALTRPKGR